MIVKQFYLSCLAHASYIVIDERTRTAVVIDPQRDVDQYLAEAERHGARIAHVFLTHYHADFVAGHLELRERVGARIHVGRRAAPEYAAEAHADGDRVEIGDVVIEVRETPGHTPEGVSLVLYDMQDASGGADPAPHAVFTGDTLFVGDVGRPDLMSSVGVTAEELARELYRSLHEKLMPLPDDTLVYPAHGAGSMCGKALGSETFTTIGKQRADNYALQPMSEDEFVGVVTADQPEAPAYFAYDAVLNRKERQTLDNSLARALVPLDADALVRAAEAGDQIVDVRNATSFAAAHFAGSINVGLEGKFATWAGTVLSPDAGIVIVAEPGGEVEAAMRLGRIGLDHVRGYLEGGLESLRTRPELVASTERITVHELASRIDAPGGPLVLDVRTTGEFDSGHIAGARNIPLHQLQRRLDELPREADLVVICRSGYRSCVASSLLAASGRGLWADVLGGMDAWHASGLPVAVPSA